MMAASNVSNSSTSCDLLKSDDFDKGQIETYKDISINFNGLENGMEFLSVAAGVTAKDKRIKDVKNQVAASKGCKEMVSNFSSMYYHCPIWLYSIASIFPEFMNFEDILAPPNTSSSSMNCVQFVHRDYPDIIITNDTTISQLLAALQSKGYSLAKPSLALEMVG